MLDWLGLLGNIPYYTEFTSILFVVNLIFAATIIFLEHKTPATALAWIMILFLLPVIGIILYFLFAQNIARKQIFRLTGFEEETIAHSLGKQLRRIEDGSFPFTSHVADKWRELVHLNGLYGHAYFTQNNKISILTDGAHKMETLLRDIDNATESINIMYFIVKNDEIGQQLIEALTKKAKEGVVVRFLVDAMGSRHINDKVLKEYIQAGGKRAYFFPPKFKWMYLRFNYRNHRKLVVIDGEVGYIGGFNIAREYVGKKKKFGYWRDTHLRIMGGCVQDINTRFLQDWRFASKEEVIINEAYYSNILEVGRSGVQIVSSGPDSQRVEVKRAYMKMITSAKERIYLQTPYFVPDESILESLKMAAQSGVDVRVMIPHMPDHMFVYWATYSYVGELIRSGCKAYIYDEGFLHAKTLVVDGEVASVGSANFDVRSFKLNFEANAIIFDELEAGKLEDIFHKDMEKSHQLTLELYEQRSMVIRFKESISRLISGIL